MPIHKLVMYVYESSLAQITVVCVCVCMCVCVCVSGRQRLTKNWEDNDYYDSDEDSFLDRTGEC